MTYKLKKGPKKVKIIDNNTYIGRILEEAEREADQENENTKYYTHEEFMNNMRRAIYGK